MFFITDNRQKIKDENPDLDAQDILKKGGELWRSMSAEDKKPYEEKAAKDKVSDRTRFDSHCIEGAIPTRNGELRPSSRSWRWCCEKQKQRQAKSEFE